MKNQLISEEQAAPFEVPPKQVAPAEYRDTEAATVAANKFEITEREHLDFYGEKRYALQLEVQMIDLKAEQKIKAVKASAEEEKKPLLREAKSLKWHFAKQVEKLCRSLIKSQKKGKSLAFQYGVASTRAQSLGIGLLLDEKKKDTDARAAALSWAKKSAPECVQEFQPETPPPALKLDALKTLMADKFANLRDGYYPALLTECLVAHGGELEPAETQAKAIAAERAKAKMEKDYPFLEITPEHEKFELKIDGVVDAL